MVFSALDTARCSSRPAGWTFPRSLDARGSPRVHGAIICATRSRLPTSFCRQTSFGECVSSGGCERVRASVCLCWCERVHVFPSTHLLLMLVAGDGGGDGGGGGGRLLLVLRWGQVVRSDLCLRGVPVRPGRHAGVGRRLGRVAPRSQLRCRRGSFVLVLLLLLLLPPLLLLLLLLLCCCCCRRCCCCCCCCCS